MICAHTGKQAYPNPQRAQRALSCMCKRRQSRHAHKQPGRLQVFKCRCGGFHVGHGLPR